MTGAFIYHENKPTEIVMSMLTTRAQYNKVISLMLLTLVDKNPDMRFQQILVNSGIWEEVDPFYEESKKTLEELLENDFVKKYFIKSKVVGINEFKSAKK